MPFEKKKNAFDLGHLSKSGVHWAKHVQLREYQKLQNEESIEALINKSPFEVFYGRKSNAVLNHIPGGRCVIECNAIRSRAKKATDVWDKRYIYRPMQKKKKKPPSTYELGENVMTRYHFSHTSKAGPKGRFVVTVQVLKRNLKIQCYKVSCQHPQTGDKTTS